MRRILAVLLLSSPGLLAWNYTGHRVIAAMAYDRLTDTARIRVDALMAIHPDYSLFRLELTPAVDQDARARARAVFIRASIWPDTLRTDPRFYDEANPNAARTPLLPGFPDMEKHETWHYYGAPYSTDGTPLIEHSAPHALTELNRLLGELGKSGHSPTSDSYDLVWLLHLVADVHQPLHAIRRYSASQPNGDQGGNLVFIAPNRNLHAVWDQAVGTDTSPANVERLAKDLAPTQDESPPTSPAHWLEESFELDKQVVYSFGNRTGSKEAPIELPKSYHQRVVEVSKLQITKASMRLALVLNKIFR